MILILVNLAMTIWILKVMNFTIVSKTTQVSLALLGGRGSVGQGERGETVSNSIQNVQECGVLLKKIIILFRLHVMMDSILCNLSSSEVGNLISRHSPLYNFTYAFPLF